MTAPDIRLSCAFFRHEKTEDLLDALGAEGVVALLRLWCAIAESDRDHSGDLSGWSDARIERRAGWRGPPRAFVEALGITGWMEGEELSRRIHDWAEHQRYLKHAASRREQATRAAAVRYAKRRGLPLPEEKKVGSGPMGQEEDRDQDQDQDQEEGQCSEQLISTARSSAGSSARSSAGSNARSTARSTGGAPRRVVPLDVKRSTVPGASETSSRLARIESGAAPAPVALACIDAISGALGRRREGEG